MGFIPLGDGRYRLPSSANNRRELEVGAVGRQPAAKADSRILWAARILQWKVSQLWAEAGFWDLFSRRTAVVVHNRNGYWPVARPTSRAGIGGRKRISHTATAAGFLITEWCREISNICKIQISGGIRSNTIAGHPNGRQKEVVRRRNLLVIQVGSG